MNTRKANNLGFIAIGMWITTPLMIIGAGNTPPLLMATYTFMLASVFLFLNDWLFGKAAKNYFKRPILFYFLTTYGFAGCIIFWFLGFKFAPVFDANTLNYTWPILLVVFSNLLNKTMPSILAIAGIVAGFVGVVLVFYASIETNTSYNLSIGHVFALTGAFVWASYSSLIKFFKLENESMAPTMILPFIICFVLHILFEKSYTPTVFEGCCIIGLGFTRISFIFWSKAMTFGNVDLLSTFSYLIPVISTLLLVVLGFVPSSLLIWFGATLVVCACVMANFDNLKTQKSKRDRVSQE